MKIIKLKNKYNDSKKKSLYYIGFEVSDSINGINDTVLDELDKKSLTVFDYKPNQKDLEDRLDKIVKTVLEPKIKQNNKVTANDSVLFTDIKLYDMPSADMVDSYEPIEINLSSSVKDTSVRDYELYRGCPGVKYIWHGEWADSELEYDGQLFSYYDVEDILWQYFLEDTGHTDTDSGDPKIEEEFNKYVQKHCIALLKELMANDDID